MSGIRWSDEETRVLIELYKAYPFLWDSSHKMYKKGQVRNFAYTDILSTLKKPGLTTRDIRCKIKNLRSSYYQEIKKISVAESLGMKYISGLSWFDGFNDIMDVIQENKMKIGTEAEVEREDEDGEDEILDGEGIEIIESAHLIPENDTMVVSIKQEFLDEMENKDVRFCPIISEYMDPLETSEVNKKKSKTTKGNKRETRLVDLDEFQLFANSMATQLRNMPLVKALNLQVEVQALIAKERIDACKNDEGNDEEMVE